VIRRQQALLAAALPFMLQCFATEASAQDGGYGLAGIPSSVGHSFTVSEQQSNRAGGAAISLGEEQRLAKRGDLRSQVALGFAYFLGQGVPKNYKRAAGWFRKAVKQGHTDDQSAYACYALGYFYREGLSVERDQELAVRWFQKAAELGNVSAQVSLANAYSSGVGITRDAVRALMWMRVSEAQGDQHVLAERERISALMTTAEIAEAERLSQQWLTSRGIEKPQVPAAIPPVGGGQVLWSDMNGGNYSVSLYNRLTQDITNVLFQVIFYDSQGHPIETDVVRYGGVIPAGLSKRVTSKVDASIHELTRVGGLKSPNEIAHNTEVRVVSFDVMR
jgi:hypothetical protein